MEGLPGKGSFPLANWSLPVAAMQEVDWKCTCRMRPLHAEKCHNYTLGKGGSWATDGRAETHSSNTQDAAAV